MNQVCSPLVLCKQVLIHDLLRCTLSFIYMCVGGAGSRAHRGDCSPLELELQVVRSHLMWVLGNLGTLEEQSEILIIDLSLPPLIHDNFMRTRGKWDLGDRALFLQVCRLFTQLWPQSVPPEKCDYDTMCRCVNWRLTTAVLLLWLPQLRSACPHAAGMHWGETSRH